MIAYSYDRKRPIDGAVDDYVLEQVAEGHGTPAQMESLGYKLGFSHSALKTYTISSGGVEVMYLLGYRNMLFDWKRRTRRTDQLKILRRALQDAGLGHVAATILQAGKNLLIPNVINMFNVNI